MISYEQGLNMARTMKKKDPDILEAIHKVTEAKHGVVALRFSNKGRDVAIEILDEPYDDNVRVYPG